MGVSVIYLKLQICLLTRVWNNPFVITNDDSLHTCIGGFLYRLKGAQPSKNFGSLYKP